MRHDQPDRHGRESRRAFEGAKADRRGVGILERDSRAAVVAPDGATLDPKPVQRPNPPVLLGGETDYTLARVVEYCDGWFPRGGVFQPARDMGRLKTMAEKAGRDPADLSVSVFRAPADKQQLEEYAQAGVDRAILELPPQSEGDIRRRLDEYQHIVEQ